MQFTHIKHQFIQLLNIQQLTAREELINGLHGTATQYSSSEAANQSKVTSQNDTLLRPLSQQQAWHVLFEHSPQANSIATDNKFFADIRFALQDLLQLTIVLDETLSTDFTTQPTVFIVRAIAWLKTTEGKRQLWQWLWQQIQ